MSSVFKEPVNNLLYRGKGNAWRVEANSQFMIFSKNNRFASSYVRHPENNEQLKFQIGATGKSTDIYGWRTCDVRFEIMSMEKINILSYIYNTLRIYRA